MLREKESGAEMYASEVKDAEMQISSSDFPGNETVAEEVIKELEGIYEDDALMSYMNFSRGSVLIQDARSISPRKIIQFLER